jgi:hypothetical protein
MSDWDLGRRLGRVIKRRRVEPTVPALPEFETWAALHKRAARVAKSLMRGEYCGIERASWGRCAVSKGPYYTFLGITGMRGRRVTVALDHSEKGVTYMDIPFYLLVVPEEGVVAAINLAVQTAHNMYNEIRDERENRMIQNLHDELTLMEHLKGEFREQFQGAVAL